MPSLERDGFVTCPRCDGAEERVECLDDLCHATGECIHGDNTCALCAGHGVVSEELRDRWLDRKSFASVELPAADRQLRGGV